MHGGIYRGKVTNSNDPEKLYRIKALIPLVLGEQESDWAWPCVDPGWFDGLLVPNAGAHVQYTGTGTHTHTLLKQTPTPGQAVWMMFEAGEVDKPVWMGTWRIRA